VTFLNLRVAASGGVKRFDAALGVKGLSCRVWPPNETPRWLGRGRRLAKGRDEQRAQHSGEKVTEPSWSSPSFALPQSSGHEQAFVLRGVSSCA